MENEQKKQVVFSAIQPSGTITLGNYLGAVRNWVRMQDEYNCIYALADMHTITVRQEPAQMRKNILDAYASIMACGIDVEKSIFFIQSHVHTHAEMAWILNCYTQFGELSRMTQFKDKSAKHADNINAGLFTYPSLMAGDILLYQADKVPEPYIPKVGARIMSLSNPTSKMSKSDPQGCVFLMDSPDELARKFKRAVTDSDTERCVRFDPENKPGVANLMNIYASVTGRSYAEIEEEFDGKGYGVFKPAVGEAVIENLRPIREQAERIIADKAYLQEVYTQGAQKAGAVARRTLRKVYRKIGLVEKPF